MRSVIPILFAPILFGLFSFASPQGGATGIGTLPVFDANHPLTEGTAGAPGPGIVVYRELAGSPGVVVTARRGNVLLVAQSAPWGPGTEDLATPPEVVVASWTSGGVQFSVTYTQGPNESMPDFHRRVDASVRSWQILRPRDGAPTGSCPNHP